MRALQKRQVVFEKTIKASADQKLLADQALVGCVSAMNDCDMQVETCKADVQAVVSNRAAVEQRLRAAVEELQRLQSQHDEAAQRWGAVRVSLVGSAHCVPTDCQL